MNQKYCDDIKREIISRYQAGERVTSLQSATGIPRSTIYAWLKEEQDNAIPVTQRQIYILESKIKRLEGIIEILQGINCTVTAPLKEKLYAIEELQGKYSVHMLCDALKIPRGTYYNHILRNKRDHSWYAKRREELRERIQRVYDDSKQIYGAGKIVSVLREEGIRTSEKMVRELMRDMGLTSIREGAKALYDREQKPYKNYVNQQFTVHRPNEVWVGDVTFYRYKEQNFYICAILDLYARRVVGYKIGKRNSTQLIKSTVNQAVAFRKPKAGLIFHSDRGANFRSKSFMEHLKNFGITQSFSRAHVPYDNSVMESFFASLKREELYRTKYRSEKEFRTAVDTYMVFYNEQRPHGKNGYKTPAKKEQEYYEKQGIF